MSPRGIAFLALIILSPYIFLQTAAAQDDQQETSPLDNRADHPIN
jgi:hypothetical protein